MNKHFEDTRYYLKRAGETAKRGVAEELEPLQERVSKLVGEEEEPEPTRTERVQAELQDIQEELHSVQERAEGEAREAIEQARERLGRAEEPPAQ